MWNQDCGCAPVCDEDGRVVGMITDRDVCMAAYTQGKALDQLRVGDAMARQVIACSPRDSIQEAEQRMQTARVRRLPVVDDDGRLCGMISLADLARRFDAQSSSPKVQEVGRTLASICQPLDRSAAPEATA